MTTTNPYDKSRFAKSMADRDTWDAENARSQAPSETLRDELIQARRDAVHFKELADGYSSSLEASVKALEESDGLVAAYVTRMFEMQKELDTLKAQRASGLRGTSDGFNADVAEYDALKAENAKLRADLVNMSARNVEYYDEICALKITLGGGEAKAVESHGALGDIKCDLTSGGTAS